MATPGQSAKQRQGSHWEQVALDHLQRHGLQLVQANYRCRGGEIDLILRDGDCLVFVEVRQRADLAHGGAAASITAAKQRRLIRAAQTYLLHCSPTPPCRFDVVAIDGGRLNWLRNAIQAT
jgi:putative endonuclease